MKTFFPAIALWASCATACGGETPPPATPSVAPAAASPEAGGEAAVPAVWSKDLPKEQAIAYMKKNVLGPMGAAFRAQDSDRYASFSCKTCHGPAFKDPHEALPHLTFQNGKIIEFSSKPEVAGFMAKVVAPEMARALGAKPFDPATNTGFGCAGCHTLDTK